MQQLKDGKKTSTMALSIAAMLLSTMMPFILSAFDEYVKTLPPNSWVAIIAPVVVSSIYAIHRALTANNARDNEAKIEIAKLTGQAPDSTTEINAGGNVSTGATNTPQPASEAPQWTARVGGSAPFPVETDRWSGHSLSVIEDAPLDNEIEEIQAPSK